MLNLAFNKCNHWSYCHNIHQNYSLRFDEKKFARKLDIDACALVIENKRAKDKNIVKSPRTIFDYHF